MAGSICTSSFDASKLTASVPRVLKSNGTVMVSFDVKYEGEPLVFKTPQCRAPFGFTFGNNYNKGDPVDKKKWEVTLSMEGSSKHQELVAALNKVSAFLKEHFKKNTDAIYGRDGLNLPATKVASEVVKFTADYENVLNILRCREGYQPMLGLKLAKASSSKPAPKVHTPEDGVFLELEDTDRKYAVGAGVSAYFTVRGVLVNLAMKTVQLEPTAFFVRDMVTNHDTRTLFPDEMDPPAEAPEAVGPPADQPPLFGDSPPQPKRAKRAKVE